MSSRAIAEAAASLFHLLYNFCGSIHPHFPSLTHKHIYSRWVVRRVCSSRSFILLEFYTFGVRMFITQAGHFGWFHSQECDKHLGPVLTGSGPHSTLTLHQQSINNETHASEVLIRVITEIFMLHFILSPQKCNTSHTLDCTVWNLSTLQQITVSNY